jgi:hypothetical protein
MTIYGEQLQQARRKATVAVSAFPVNSTVILYALVVPTGMGKIRIEAVNFVASAALNDADGTMLVSVIARDASEGADDTLVASASVEGVTAHVPVALTLATETAENEFTLEEGDSLRVTFVNNSAAIDTNGSCMVEITYFPIPLYGSMSRVGHPSNYGA